MLHSRMLGYLDEVARAGSISRAADRLGIAASSINRQILELEAEYGLPLFERLPRRMRLTAAGELLILHVRRTIRDHLEMRSQFLDLKGERRGLVRIATMGGLANTLMPPLAEWMRVKLPRVKLSIRAMSLEALVHAVINAEADLGLGYELPFNPKMRVIAQTTSRIGAVMTPAHPLAQRVGGGAMVALADCVRYPMVIPDRSITIGGFLAEAFERCMIATETIAETNSVEVLKRAVRLGETIAFLSEVEVEVEVRQKDLVFLPLRGSGRHQQHLKLVSRRTAPLDPTQSRVAEELRRMIMPAQT